MTQLEEEVKSIIEKLYCAKYRGTLRVEELKNSDGTVRGYIVRLGLNNHERPIFIAFEGDKKHFIKFLIEELKIKRLDVTKYFYGDKIYRKGRNEKCCH